MRFRGYNKGEGLANVVV